MYANGRAKGPGRWNRHGTQVKAAHDGRPLPFSLQILPMRKTPLPVHPGCATTKTQYGLQSMMERWDTLRFHCGTGLSRKPNKYRVECAGKTFYTDDPMYGLAFVRAAQHYRHRLVASMTEE